MVNVLMKLWVFIIVCVTVSPQPLLKQTMNARYPIAFAQFHMAIN